MRKFTKSLLTLALLVLAGGSAKADDVVEDLTASMFKTWSTTDADAVATGNATIDFNVGNEISAGNVLCGTGSVDGFIFADLSNYTKITFTGTPAEGKTLTLRILNNRVGAAGANGEKQITVSAGTPAEFSIADLVKSENLTYFHLVTIKVAWGDNAGTVSSIKLTKPADPLEVPKANLKTAIDKGKMCNSFAKTSASWNALQTAISDGEAEYANGSATAESLNAATTVIDKAISGLKLEDGYVNLTGAMFKQYTSVENPGEGSKPGTTVELFTASGLPYGDGNVGEKNWADMTAFDKFIILTIGDVKPRLCMNRLEAGGNQAATQAESKMIDINPNNENTWSTEKYQTIDGNSFTIDLKKIVDDYGFARLHSVKKQGWGSGVTVTDFLLYRTLTVGASGYATFGCADNSAKLNGVKSYAAKLSGNKLVLTEVTNVPAGKGVIVEATEGEYIPTFDVDADNIDSDLKVSNGYVVGDGSTIYVLANGAKGVGFYKLADGDKVPAGKVYLKTGAGAPEFIGFACGTTGINDVTSKMSDVRGEYFNIAGQRVAQPTKGLYIVNGKKVIVK